MFSGDRFYVIGLFAEVKNVIPFQLPLMQTIVVTTNEGEVTKFLFTKIFKIRVYSQFFS